MVSGMAEPQGTEPPEKPEAPEQIKNLRWLYHHLQANWEVLVKPPVILTLLLFAAGGGWLGYWSGTKQSTQQEAAVAGRLDIANDRITFLQDQLAAYKDRLQGATPDQAARQVTVLQASLGDSLNKLKMLFPDVNRSLSDKQKAFIISHAADFKSLTKSIPVYGWSVGDSLFYGSDFVNALNGIGIQALGPVAVPCGPHETGVQVGVADVAKPPASAVQFISLLTEMGVQAHKDFWGFKDLFPNADFDLFICGQP